MTTFINSCLESCWGKASHGWLVTTQQAFSAICALTLLSSCVQRRGRNSKERSGRKMVAMKQSELCMAEVLGAYDRLVGKLPDCYKKELVNVWGLSGDCVLLFLIFLHVFICFWWDDWGGMQIHKWEVSSSLLSGSCWSRGLCCCWLCR